MREIIDAHGCGAYIRAVRRPAALAFVLLLSGCGGVPFGRNAVLVEHQPTRVGGMNVVYRGTVSGAMAGPGECCRSVRVDIDGSHYIVSVPGSFEVNGRTVQIVDVGLHWQTDARTLTLRVE